MGPTIKKLVLKVPKNIVNIWIDFGLENKFSLRKIAYRLIKVPCKNLPLVCFFDKVDCSNSLRKKRQRRRIRKTNRYTLQVSMILSHRNRIQFDFVGIDSGPIDIARV